MQSFSGDRTSTLRQKPERRYDLDWIRVLGMVTIFFYHCGRFFNLEDWHVKNNLLSYGISIVLGFMVIWMMPLFFMVSSISSSYSLNKRSPGHYIVERFKRLVIPFVFGTLFILVPVQVYIERVTHDQFSGSFIEFYPHYFNGFYAFGGNFAWMGLHLWYLEMLFIFSLLTLPLFLLVRSPRYSDVVTQVTSFFVKPGAIFLLAVPLILMEMFVGQYRDTIGTQAFGGWSLLTYLVFFVTAYFLSLDPRFRKAIEGQRIPALVLAVAITLLGLMGGLYELQAVGKNSDTLAAVASWCWLLAIFGFGSRYLSFSRPVLVYANEAVLPFYILHQTVIVIFGFWMAQWNIGILAKYLILSSFSFVTIMVLYEYPVKRVSLMRFLFGMK